MSNDLSTGLAGEAMAEADYDPTSKLARQKTRRETPILIRISNEDAALLDRWIRSMDNRVSNRTRGIAVKAMFDPFIASLRREEEGR